MDSSSTDNSDMTAEDMTAVMATSTTAERVFSTLGLVLTKRRLSLTGENVNKLLFLSDKLKR